MIAQFVANNTGAIFAFIVFRLFMFGLAGVKHFVHFLESADVQKGNAVSDVKDYGFDRWMHDYKIISTIGENEQGGIDRLAYTREDTMARTELLNRAYGLRLQCYLDAAENLWFYKPGTDPTLPPLVIGSHLDAVPNGGKYDGVLGVMTGFQILRYLVENKVEHRRGIELVAFGCEESSRFNLSAIGSKLACGLIGVEELAKYKDSQGLSPLDCLDRLAFSADSIKERTEHLKTCYGYLELHIEQGPVLESENVDVGIVEAIAAPVRMKVKFTGNAAHSGACPMHLRHDALAAAAEAVSAVERLGQKEAEHKTVATVGKINVPHQALNVVPGECEIFIDVRGIDRESVLAVCDGLHAELDHIESERGIAIERTLLSDEEPVLLDHSLGEIIQRNCEKVGLSYKWMPSGAGHDAMDVAKLIPSAMIFVPCIGGVSHNLHEQVTEKAMKDGLQILYEVVMDICE